MLSVICIIFGANQNAFSSFQNTGIGARATGLNNAYTADADDVHGVYYNPAGMVQIESPEFTSYYGKLYTGLSDGSNLGNNFFAYAHPLRIKKSRSARNMRLISQDDGVNYYGTIGAAYQEFKLDGLYKETSIYLSYARIFLPDFYIGMTLKSLAVSYGTDMYTQNAISMNNRARGDIDPIFASGRSKRVTSFDLGFLYRITSDIKAGLMLANINQPDISLQSSGNKVNFSARAGVSGEFDFGKINLDLVNEKNLASGTDRDVLLGYENWLDLIRYGEVGLRCGFGAGSRGYKSASMGFSYSINMVQLDYGMTIPLAGIEDTMGTHRISMTFRFGKEVKDEELGQLMEKEERLFRQAKEEISKAMEEKKRLEFEIERMKAELSGTRKGDIARTKREIVKLEGDIEKAREKYAEAFNIARKFYNTRILKGLNLQDRIIILDKIIQKYAAVGIDVSASQRDLDKMRAELRGKISEYKTAVRYYRVMVERGASEKDRRDILTKLISKYKDYGFDTVSYTHLTLPTKRIV